MKLPSGASLASQVPRTGFIWFSFLDKVIGSLVWNPQKDAVLVSCPKAFHDPPYRDVRHIIDGTEVFIETPKSLELAASCYSEYKHHHTAKFHISINPNGHINYVLNAWGGRVSDNQLTQHCGFLKVLDPFDKVNLTRNYKY